MTDIFYNRYIPGFPRPYQLMVPLLAVGYISGWDDQQYFLNMAVNPGNSGGLVMSSGKKTIGVIVNYILVDTLRVNNGLDTLGDLNTYSEIHYSSDLERYLQNFLVGNGSYR